MLSSILTALLSCSRWHAGGAEPPKAGRGPGRNSAPPPRVSAYVLTPMRDVIVLGSGPAGLTAAIYATRAGLRPLVFEGAEAGGQLMLTTEVENYPGFADPILGPDLMATMRKQADRVCSEFLSEDAVQVDLWHLPFSITSQSGETSATKELITGN